MPTATIDAPARSKLFLSFSEPDKPQAERLAKELSQRGITAWWSAQSVQPGESMGYAAVVLLAAVMVISGYILMHPEGLPSFVLTAASGALFVDVVGLLVGVWRISMNPRLVSQLAPVTDGALPKQKSKKPRKTETPRAGVALPPGSQPLMSAREPSKTAK